MLKSAKNSSGSRSSEEMELSSSDDDLVNTSTPDLSVCSSDGDYEGLGLRKWTVR